MRERSAAVTTALLLAASMLDGCSPQPAAAPASPPPTELTAVLSVQELMEHVVDPIADWIFDAAVIDISEKGVVETKPLTDEDWLKVERGALILAESANLLKMPRAMVPAGHSTLDDAPGGPELTPGEIEARIKQDPAMWNRHADGLRTAALESLTLIKSRDSEKLFDAGDRIDKACEACHLEYWYPGDKAVVEESQKNRVTYDK